MSDAGIVDAMHAAILAAAADLGVDPEAAERLAERVIGHVCRAHGGSVWYVRVANRRPERNAAIRADYRRGAILAELMLKYRLSERQIRVILADAHRPKT